MANVLSVVYAVIGFVVMHTAVLIWTALMLPRAVDRARQRLMVHPVISFIWGLVFFALTLVGIAAYLPLRGVGERMLNDGFQNLATRLEATRAYGDTWFLINVPTWLIAAPILAGAVVGGAAYSQIFAARARLLMRTDSPLAALMLGALCTSLAYFLPFVGWFVFLPLVGLTSIGSGVLGIFSRREFTAR